VGRMPKVGGGSAGASSPYAIGVNRIPHSHNQHTLDSLPDPYRMQLIRWAVREMQEMPALSVNRLPYVGGLAAAPSSDFRG